MSTSGKLTPGLVDVDEDVAGLEAGLLDLLDGDGRRPFEDGDSGCSHVRDSSRGQWAAGCDLGYVQPRPTLAG